MKNFQSKKRKIILKIILINEKKKLINNLLIKIMSRERERERERDEKIEAIINI